MTLCNQKHIGSPGQRIGRWRVASLGHHGRVIRRVKDASGKGFLDRLVSYGSRVALALKHENNAAKRSLWQTIQIDAATTRTRPHRRQAIRI